MIKKILITIVLIFSMMFCKANAQDINIVFTIDNNYPALTMIAMNSILKSNSSKSDFTFYVVENNITAFNKNLMKIYAHFKKIKLNFVHVDTKTFDNGRYFFTFTNRITPIAMARIVVPELLPQSLDRIIYMDADIFVKTDLSELYNYDLKGYPAGLVENIVMMHYDLHKFKKYYNSGIILIDLNEWRSQKISNKLVSYLKNHADDFVYDDVNGYDKYMYPDQDLINIVLEDNIETLPKKWNTQPYWQNENIDSSFEGIIHFIGPQKPWNSKRIRYNSVKMYNDAWNKSLMILYKPFFWYMILAKEKKELYKNIFKHIKEL